MNKINNLVSQYDYENEVLLKQIVSQAEVQDIVKTIVDLLAKDKAHKKTSGLMELVCDILICRGGWVSRQYSSAFRKCLNASSFPKVLDSLLIGKDKTLNTSLFIHFKYLDHTYLPIMQKALKRAIQQEPFEIPILFFEIKAKTRKFDWEIMNGLAKSKSFMNRWAALDIIGHFELAEDQEFLNSALNFAQKLEEDQNPFIAYEAKYVLAKFAFKKHYENSKPKSRKAEESYSEKIYPYQKILYNLYFKYSFGGLQIIYRNLRAHYPNIKPSAQLYEALISLAWKYDPAKKNYLSNLAKDIQSFY